MPQEGLCQPGRAKAHSDVQNRRSGKYRRKAHIEVGGETAADDDGKLDRPPSDELGDGKHRHDANRVRIEFQATHSAPGPDPTDPVIPETPSPTRAALRTS
jgi:hypothetical protein